MGAGLGTGIERAQDKRGCAAALPATGMLSSGSHSHPYCCCWQGAGNTGQHNAIGNWMYWSWNANSGDTGGLIDDNWRELMWVKIRFLVNKLGLKPWYLK